MSRPYAEDWEDLGNGLSYSPHLELWYKDGMVYDELSANHNGIIGMGAQLKTIVRSTNAQNFRKKIESGNRQRGLPLSQQDQKG